VQRPTNDDLRQRLSKHGRIVPALALGSIKPSTQRSYEREFNLACDHLRVYFNVAHFDDVSRTASVMDIDLAMAHIIDTYHQLDGEGGARTYCQYMVAALEKFVVNRPAAMKITDFFANKEQWYKFYKGL
jgi:hypothetical protein